MSDITIDTNVFVHALNHEEIRNTASLALLQTLLNTTCKIVIDTGFDMDESKNKSLIGAEYLKHLPPGSLPYAIVANLAQNERISFVKKSTQPHISKKINQALRNKRDRTFIIVCINSERKKLVTHDYEDFNPDKRKFFNKEFKIELIEAEDANQIISKFN